jgi:prevent-host-death family protein
LNQSRQSRQSNPMPTSGWKLGEAKAKFSELVRLAKSGHPQRVTVHGKEAVVIVATDTFEALQAREQSTSLHQLLSQSPLSRITFGGDGVRSPVREVEL